jgi:hypothetical protein
MRGINRTQNKNKEKKILAHGVCLQEILEVLRRYFINNFFASYLTQNSINFILNKVSQVFIHLLSHSIVSEISQLFLIRFYIYESNVGALQTFHFIPYFSVVVVCAASSQMLLNVFNFFYLIKLCKAPLRWSKQASKQEELSCCRK